MLSILCYAEGDTNRADTLRVVPGECVIKVGLEEVPWHVMSEAPQAPLTLDLFAPGLLTSQF